jgi:hypothetical protein
MFFLAVYLKGSALGLNAALNADLSCGPPWLLAQDPTGLKDAYFMSQYLPGAAGELPLNQPFRLGSHSVGSHEQYREHLSKLMGQTPNLVARDRCYVPPPVMAGQAPPVSPLIQNMFVGASSATSLMMNNANNNSADLSLHPSFFSEAPSSSTLTAKHSPEDDLDINLANLNMESLDEDTHEPPTNLLAPNAINPDPGGQVGFVVTQQMQMKSPQMEAHLMGLASGMSGENVPCIGLPQSDVQIDGEKAKQMLAEMQQLGSSVPALRSLHQDLDLANVPLSTVQQLQASIRQDLEMVEQEMQNRNVCLICKNRRATVCINPCMHSVLCYSCAMVTPDCPLCGSHVFQHSAAPSQQSPPQPPPI